MGGAKPSRGAKLKKYGTPFLVAAFRCLLNPLLCLKGVGVFVGVGDLEALTTPAPHKNLNRTLAELLVLIHLFSYNLKEWLQVSHIYCY